MQLKRVTTNLSAKELWLAMSSDEHSLSDGQWEQYYQECFKRPNYNGEDETASKYFRTIDEENKTFKQIFLELYKNYILPISTMADCNLPELAVIALFLGDATAFLQQNVCCFGTFKSRSEFSLVAKLFQDPPRTSEMKHSILGLGAALNNHHLVESMFTAVKVNTLSDIDRQKFQFALNEALERAIRHKNEPLARAILQYSEQQGKDFLTSVLVLARSQFSSKDDYEYEGEKFRIFITGVRQSFDFFQYLISFAESLGFLKSLMLNNDCNLSLQSSVFRL